MHSHRVGFTLLELSIVLVVIALIVGAVTIGTAMIRNAELQSVVADVDAYKKAMGLFRDKYQSLPGDMTTATDLWGSAAGCPNIAATNTVATATCNGNGDGFIGDSDSGAPTAMGSNYQEQMRVWQHLGNAELINKKYTGTISSTNNELNPGINIPASKRGTNGFAFFYAIPVISNANYFAAEYGHIFVYGAVAGGGAGATPPRTAGLSGEDAAQIDMKVDDGKPGTGSVLTYKTTILASCASSNTQTTAIYSVSQGATDVCSLIFISGM